MVLQPLAYLQHLTQSLSLASWVLHLARLVLHLASWDLHLANIALDLASLALDLVNMALASLERASWAPANMVLGQVTMALELA